ncbi:MAG: pilus assembly protein PilM [bacterium]
MISIGLTVSKDKINIAQVKGTYRKLSSIKTQEIPTGIGEGEVALYIKRFFKKNNIKTKYICLGLPRRQILVNIIELPPIKKDLISQALKYEVEEHIPYPIEEVYYDYQIIGQFEKKTNILLVAVRKEVVDPYLQLLSQIELKPLFVDVDSFSIINLCLELFSNEFKHNTTLLISSETDCSEISLLKNEKLEFTKSLPFLTDDTVFLEEIKKIIDYFQTSSEGFKIDKIILTKGISNGIAQNLKQELGISTIVIDPLASLTSEGGDLSTISSAWRGIKEGKLSIDLSPMKEIRAKELRKTNYIKTGILVTLIFILLNGIFHLNLISREGKLETIDGIISKNQSLLSEIVEIQEEFQLFQGAKEDKIEYLDLLLELSNILPSNAWIKNVTFEKDQLKELSGTTLGSASVLLPILEASPYLKNVEFTGSIVKHRLENQELEEFSLKANLVSGKE